MNIPTALLPASLLMIACLASGCSSPPEPCELPDYGPPVQALIRTPDGRPAAAGAWVTVNGIDTGWGAPNRAAVEIRSGDRLAPLVLVRVEKPWYQTFWQAVHLEYGVCGMEGTQRVDVTLNLLPNAPPVRQVMVNHGSLHFHGKSVFPLRAYVDAANDTTDAVTWWSSDTTVVTVDSSGVVTSKCLDAPATAFVSASALLDPFVRDSIAVAVDKKTPGAFNCPA